MPRTKKEVKPESSKALNVGATVSSSVKSTGKLIGNGTVDLARNMKEGSVHVAKGAGFFARQVAVVVADFGRGLKKGWER